MIDEPQASHYRNRTNERELCPRSLDPGRVRKGGLIGSNTLKNLILQKYIILDTTCMLCYIYFDSRNSIPTYIDHHKVDSIAAEGNKCMSCWVG